MEVLGGLLAIVVVVGLGALFSRRGILDAAGQRALGEIAFYAAMPALIVVTISDVHVDGAGANLVVSGVALLTAGGLYALLAGWWWRQDRRTVVIGALASSYVNAGNLGLAFAAYVVGEPTVVVPTLLIQLLVVQPLSLAYLDRSVGRRGVRTALRRITTNPLTVASLLGVVLAVTGHEIPAALQPAVRLLAGLAIPAMLLSYGAGLHRARRAGRVGVSREVVAASVVKVAVMPLVAFAVATTLGLDGTALLGVVLTAALPTAQNIYLHATRYRRGEDVARETIFVTTVCSVPVLLGVAVLLG